MQDWVDLLREKLAVRHQQSAKRHIAKRDYWRSQIYEPWVEMVGTILTCVFAAALIVLWLIWG